MDDPNKCTLGSSIFKTYFTSYGQDAYVKAWGRTSYHTPPTTGCTARFASYGAYGMRYSFSSGDYIRDCGVTLRIYDSSNSYGIPMVTK